MSCVILGDSYIYLIIKGKYIAVVLLFLWNSIAVFNIDNIFRGKFLPVEARIDNTLIFISVLSGVMLFGVLDVLYGPLLAVIGVTAIDLYKELQQESVAKEPVKKDTAIKVEDSP